MKTPRRHRGKSRNRKSSIFSSWKLIKPVFTMKRLNILCRDQSVATHLGLSCPASMYICQNLMYPSWLAVANTVPSGDRAPSLTRCQGGQNITSSPSVQTDRNIQKLSVSTLLRMPQMKEFSQSTQNPFLQCFHKHINAAETLTSCFRVARRALLSQPRSFLWRATLLQLLKNTTSATKPACGAGRQKIIFYPIKN